MLAQAAAAIQPGYRAFHNPAPCEKQPIDNTTNDVVGVLAARSLPVQLEGATYEILRRTEFSRVRGLYCKIS